MTDSAVSILWISYKLPYYYISPESPATVAGTVNIPVVQEGSIILLVIVGNYYR